MGKCAGHFFAVAHNYYGLFKENVETLVAGGPVYRQQFEKELLSLPNDVLLCGESKFKNKWKYFQNARSLFHKAIGDTIVIQQGGVITSFLAIAMFYHQQSKLFLIQYSNEGLRSFLGRMLYKLCKSKIDGIICPNDMVGKAYERPYCVVPDYIYLDRKEQIDIPFCKKKYDVCFVGRIEEEKGVLDVARKIAGTKYRMVIAGKVRDSQLGEKLQALNSRCSNIELHIVITAKPKAHAFKNEMCFPLTKTKCELKKHPNSKFECFFNDFNRTKTSLFLPFPSKLIQDNLVCVLELQE